MNIMQGKFSPTEENNYYQWHARIFFFQRGKMFIFYFYFFSIDEIINCQWLARKYFFHGGRKLLSVAYKKIIYNIIFKDKLKKLKSKTFRPRWLIIFTSL